MPAESSTRRRSRSRGPVELVLRGSLADRGLPGTTTNPTGPPAPPTGPCCSVRARPAAWRVAGSLQWLEARASDPAPPTGPAYDSYTHGAGGTLEAGYRVPARRGRLVRRRDGERVKGAPTASRATASAPAPRSPRPPCGRRPDWHRARGATTWSLAPAARARRLDRLDHAPVRARGWTRGWQRGAHLAHARRRQRCHAAGAGRPLLPGGRRCTGQSRSSARARALGGRGRPAPRAARRRPGRCPAVRRPGGRHDHLGAGFPLHLEPAELRRRPPGRRARPSGWRPWRAAPR